VASGKTMRRILARCADRRYRGKIAGLALARAAQDGTGLAIGNVIRQLRPLRPATIAVNGAVQVFPPAIDPEQQALARLVAPSRARTACNSLTCVFTRRGGRICALGPAAVTQRTGA
jgi:hypothetical protein